MNAETALTRAKLRAALEDAGFDLFQHFGVGDYNPTALPDARLPDFGRVNASACLIGNSRALWPVFLKHRATSESLQRAAHPLDLYVTEALTRAIEQATSARFELVLSHVLEPRPFPIQRLAEQIGFAQLAPSHLAVHAELGPWFALRAVAVLDLESGDRTADSAAVRAHRPCDGCPAPCVAALARVYDPGDPLPTPGVIAARPEPWIAIRDACPVGRQFRYGPNQLAYHYTGAHAELREDELRAAKAPAKPHGS